MALEHHDMGIGHLGFSNLIFKRKFRFTFQLQDICGGFSNGQRNPPQEVPEHYVKVASRPQLDIDEVEVNFLNARTWIPGKASWQTMTVTYIDVATTDVAPLWSWLASVYNFTNPVTLEMGSTRADYTATAVLKLWDGCGTILERWTMKDVWPQSINFGDLDYASSDEVTIELTLRYSNVQYEPLCPGFTISSCCTPCDGPPRGTQPLGGPPNGTVVGNTNVARVL